MNEEQTHISKIRQHIREYPDFPKKGILFRDIMPLFSDVPLLQTTIKSLSHAAMQLNHFDSIVGIESRGFLLATPMAYQMGKVFIAARKKGKLPGKLFSENYALEYGTDTIEIQQESISPNLNYIIVDDLLATGGTALATAKLIQKNGGKICGFIFLVELLELGGRKLLYENLEGIPCQSILEY